MPMQVPGLTPDVQPSVGATPNVSIPTPIEAFGGAVGHALSGLGAEVERSGDRIWQRAVEMQNLQNETDAKNADAEYMQKSGIMHAEFINKEGVNAGPEALKAHIKELQDLRTSIRGSLKNPMAQRMYDSSSLSFMGRNIFNAAGHSGQQMKVAANKADTARLDELGDAIGTNPEDEDMFQRNTRAAADTIQQLGERNGLPQETIDEMKKKKISSDIAKRAEGYARNGKLEHADTLYQRGQKQDLLTVDDTNKLEHVIKTTRHAVAAPSLAEDVYQSGLKDGTQTKSLKDLQDEVRERAKKMFPDDPLFEQRAIQSIDSQYGTNVRAERDLRWQNKQVIAGAQMAGADTLQKLLADPDTAKAYYNLSPSDQKAITFQYNKKADDANYTRLWGMAKSQDEDTRNAFMDLDLNKEPLSDGARRSLISERDRILKKPQEDPRVWRAMRWLKGAMGTQLAALGLDKVTESNKDDYYSFVGTLDQAIEEFQKDTGKPATQEDVVKKIAPLLIQSQTSQNWWQKNVSGGVSEDVRRVEVPDAERKKIIQANTAGGGSPLTEEQIRRVYTRAVLKERYKKQSSDAGQ